MNQTHLTAIIVWVAGLLSSLMSFFPMVPVAGQPFVLGGGVLLIILGQLLHIQGLHLDLQGHKITIKGQVADIIAQIEGALDLEPGDLMAGPTSQASTAVTTPVAPASTVPQKP